MFAITACRVSNGSTVTNGLEVQNRGTYAEKPLSYSCGRIAGGKLELCRSISIEGSHSGRQNLCDRCASRCTRTIARRATAWMARARPGGSFAEGRQPTDLTELQKNNHGKFPDTHIVAILQFGAEVPAHGSSTMPVWGPILGNMNQANVQDKQLRISNLSRYLESMQAQ